MAYYEYCSEHDGIEIYFDDKPDEDYLESLRANGWRWHRTKKCWYSYASDENEEFAEDICDAYNEEYGYDYENDEEEYEIELKSAHVICGNLIRCVDCGKNISSRASFCVNCGAPMEYIKSEYEKERIRQEKIKERVAKEKAEKERLKQEAEMRRKMEIILAEAEKRKQEEEERKRVERGKKAKEKRTKDLELLYIKDKDAFVSRICNKRIFNKLDCYAYPKGYTWTLSNKDGVEIKYDDRIKEMKIKYSEQHIEKISDAKTIEAICSFQKGRAEMSNIEEQVRKKYREELFKEMEKEKERAIRNGEYRNYGPVYTDNDGFVVSKPHYKK